MHAFTYPFPGRDGIVGHRWWSPKKRAKLSNQKDRMDTEIIGKKKLLKSRGVVCSCPHKAIWSPSVGRGDKQSLFVKSQCKGMVGGGAVRGVVGTKGQLPLI
jgi:hypothetical protein